MILEDLFIGSKRINLVDKTPEQLRHLLQQAEDQLVRYQASIVNYPPDRIEKYGAPHVIRLQRVIDSIKTKMNQDDKG